MTSFNRRRMLERLGLLASAPLLAPIARNLVREAQGAQVGKRRCAIVMVIGENMPEKPAHGILPAGAASVGSSDWRRSKDMVQVSADTAPELLAPMRSYWSKMAVVDGLKIVKEEVGGAYQHGLGFAVLSGARTLERSPETGGKPSAMTVDRHVANVLGKDTPMASILFGGSRAGSTFAAGEQKPVSEYSDPANLFAALAGKGSGSVPAGGTSNGAKLQARLLDVMRGDIKRLQMELAGSERQRLEDYLAAIDNYDKRQAALAEALQSGNCAEPPMPAGKTEAEKITSMFPMAGLALRCGLTNVIGVSVAHGFGHDDAGGFQPDVFGGGYGGHDFSGAVYAPQYKKLYHFMLKHVADLLGSLGPLVDGTSFLLMPGTTITDQGHHSMSRTGGVYFDGSATLKTGGTYTMFPQSNAPRFADLLCTFTHAAGAPTDKFNSGIVIPSLLA